MKGILEGAIKQFDILKSLEILGYSFSSLICAPVENESGKEDIHYEWKNFESADDISGNIELITSGSTNLNVMTTNILSYLKKYTESILEDLAKNYKPLGIFKTAASLVASRVLVLILGWIVSGTIENVKAIDSIL